MALSLRRGWITCPDADPPRPPGGPDCDGQLRARGPLSAEPAHERVPAGVGGGVDELFPHDGRRGVCRRCAGSRGSWDLLPVAVGGGVRVKRIRRSFQSVRIRSATTTHHGAQRSNSASRSRFPMLDAPLREEGEMLDGSSQSPQTARRGLLEQIAEPGSPPTARAARARRRVASRQTVRDTDRTAPSSSSSAPPGVG